MRIGFFGLILLVCSCANAQVIKGRILSSDTRKPVEFANVYFANTSVGTVSNRNGEFEVVAPAGRYDLVASCVGYEAYTINIQSNKIPAYLEVLLKPKVNELQEVVLEPYEKDGWSKWGKFFTDNFIGVSGGASDCRILNPEVLRFRLHKNTNTLTVTALDRLDIENNYLGYRLKYDLVSFQYNLTTRYYLFKGYPQFEDISLTNQKMQRKWMDRREKEYRGSVLHFMRSLYRNNLAKENFEVRTVTKISEEEKVRVRAAAKLKMYATEAFHGLSYDSALYYKKVIERPESLNIRGEELLTADSLVARVDTNIVAFNFPGWLEVLYPPKTAPSEYYKSISMNVHNLSLPIVTEITRTKPDPILIWPNGSFYEASTLLAVGYWTWSEKIASLLPVDYWPKK